MSALALAALADRVAELEAVLRAHEQWEADFIMDNDCWCGVDGLPCFSRAVYDAFLVVQAKRNAALPTRGLLKEASE